MENLKKWFNLSLIVFLTCGLVAAGGQQSKPLGLANAVVSDAHMEIMGVPGKIKVLGFSWGNMPAMAGTYQTTPAMPGTNQMKALFGSNDKLACNALKLNKSYAQATLFINLVGKPPIKYNIFNLAVKQVAGNTPPGKEKLSLPYSKGTLQNPVGGIPKNAFSVVISMISIVDQSLKDKGPLKKKR